MTTTTRRRFLAGALAGGALPLSAAEASEPGPPGPLQAKQETVRRGRAVAVDPDARRLVVVHDQRRTVAVIEPGRKGERIVDVGGQPLAVAVSPDGRTAAVVTAFWDAPGLALVDLDSAALLERVEAGPAPYDVAYAANGDRLVVSGGEQEATVHILDAAGELVARRPLGTLPRGIALDPGGESAWVALAGRDRVLEVGVGDGRVRRELRTPALPDRVAISPDGRRLLVSHSGLAAARVSEVDVASGHVERIQAGRLPSAVAWTGSGKRLAALGGEGAVVVLGTDTRHLVGGAPRGLAVAGPRAWTVDALTGAVSEVAL